MTPVTKKRLIVTGIIVLIVGLLFGFRDYKNSQMGTVVMNFNSGSIPTSKIKFDAPARPTSTSDQSATYKLAKGSHNVSINILGYRPFHASFDVATGDTITINVNLSLSSNSTIYSSSQVSGLGAGLTITDTKYYYGETWAALTLGANGSDAAVAVAQYSPIRRVWSLRLGPGTYFTVANTNGLPPQIQQYLQAGGYLAEDGQ